MRSFVHRLGSLAQGPKHQSQRTYTSTGGRRAHEKMIPSENPPILKMTTEIMPPTIKQPSTK
jgi:hypothetical protein